MLLAVHNLEVRYGGIRALQGVSLHINRGEIVTLIGSNGAGKTTLLRTISGLIRPTRGSMTFYANGEPVELLDLAYTSAREPQGLHRCARLRPIRPGQGLFLPRRPGR